MPRVPVEVDRVCCSAVGLISESELLRKVDGGPVSALSEVSDFFDSSTAAADSAGAAGVSLGFCSTDGSGVEIRGVSAATGARVSRVAGIAAGLGKAGGLCV